MPSPNRSSRSRSSPRQHQSCSDDSSEPIRKRNQIRSAKSPMETSVAQKLVETTKSYIAKVSKNGENLIMISQQCLEYLSNVNASNADQDELQEADKLLLQVKEASHQLSGLGIFVASKFNNPLIRSSPDSEKYFHEVHQLIQDDDYRRKLTELTVISSKLAQQLTKMGVSISHFVPSSIGDLEANTEDSASDPSLHIDPLAEPLNRDSQNEVNVGAPRRLIAAPRLFESDPRIVPLASAPEPSAINITQPTGLSNADKILSLQQELENRRQIYQNDILAEERLRTLLKTQCEQSEKSCKDMLEVQKLIKQVSELNENRDTQATVKPTSARNSSTPITESVHKDSTPENTQKIIKIKQKLHGVLESQESAPSTRAEAADGDHIRDYEEQFIAEEPTRKPKKPSNLLPDYPSSSSSVSQLAAPHKGMKLESMMKIMTPYDGTGNLSIFKRNFATLTEDPSLSPTQRNMILQSNLTGLARKCIAEIENPEEAIKLTFEMLSVAFGHNTNKRHTEEKLANLKFEQNDPHRMRLDLALHDIAFHQLRDQGVSECDERLIEILAAKLPADMRRNVSIFMARQGSGVSQAAVVAEIGVLIDSLAIDTTLLKRANSAAANEISQSHLSVNLSKISKSNSDTKESNRESPFVYNAAMFQKEFFDPITKAKLPGYYAPGTKGVHLKIFPRTFPSDEVEGSTCSVCQGKHHLIRCPLGSAEFRRILTAKSLCPICARSHNIERCRATFRCVYCDGLHHTGGCPLKEHYRDIANYPAGAKPKGTKFYRAPKNSSQ